MSERILILFLLPILAIAGVYAVNTAFDDSGNHVDILDENFNGPAGGGLVVLDQSHRPSVFYFHTVEVVDGNGNVTAEGEDYIWNQNNGTLSVVAGGDLDGDNQASIDYGYHVQAAENKEAVEAWGKTQDAVIKPLLMLIPVALVFLIVGRVRG